MSAYWRCCCWSHVYTLAPYVIVGVALWACVLMSGLHPTLAGVILALFIPTRPPPNLTALTTQASAIITAEAMEDGEVLRHGPSVPALRALDAIHDRIELPADRLLRNAGARSSYLVLPLFALANAGVALRADTFAGRERLMAAIVAGLVIGKPLGILLASALAVATAARAQAKGIFVGATRGSRGPGGNWVHDVAVHRRRSVPVGGRFRSGENCGIHRFGPVRRHRRRAADPRRAQRAGLTGIARGRQSRQMERFDLAGPDISARRREPRKRGRVRS